MSGAGCSLESLLEDESFNQPSAERKLVLQHLRKALRNNVSRHFWAACHTCGISALKHIAEGTSKDVFSSNVFTVTASISRVMVQGWNQSKSLAITVTPIKGADVVVRRHLTNRERAIHRDNNRCILTGMRVFEVAHIYPSALLHDKPDSKR
ncbi:hypothetical protein F5884DRAFT_506154 [Xylogone sp. PMI_703]|nr:hypothetical protein F5884DRAFT_506154 [Xylogone sp. PMI_703]